MKKETWKEIEYIVSSETRSAGTILEIAYDIIRTIREELEKTPGEGKSIMALRITEYELQRAYHECEEAEFKYE